ncbi:sugar transporter SWEET1 [Athalia rosae]|uniref:sugar transporter SWEET1 n=1 Tax=Athalia rosae TaxID=37344 RepID=UPI0006250647|nr:sugar transporter SWEET1 [Athalia rosae]
MGLEDYKEIVETSAAVMTMAQMFAGVFICKDIYLKGTAKGFDPMPFIGGTGMGVLMLQYALILKDSTMINVNVFGIVLNVMYYLFYYTYTPNKTETLALTGKVVALVAVILGYAQVENPENIEYRFGIIVTALMFTLIAAPLFNLGEIIKTKSSASLPFPLIFMATIVTFLWLLYGLIIDNGFIIFQNAVGFTLSATQLSLFVIYPSKSPVELEPETEKKQN